MGRIAITPDRACVPPRWRAASRRLFTLISALSLLLCVATAALWARSYRVGDYGEFLGFLESRGRESVTRVRYLGLYSTNGRLGVGVNQHDYLRGTPNLYHYPEGRRLVWGNEYCWEASPFTPMEGSAVSRSWTGIDVRNRVWHGYQFTMTSRGVAAPHWLIVSLTAVLPLLWLGPHWRRFRRRRRVSRLLSQNRCPDCGYDLRATPGLCPECGSGVMRA